MGKQDDNKNAAGDFLSIAANVLGIAADLKTVDAFDALKDLLDTEPVKSALPAAFIAGAPAAAASAPLALAFIGVGIIGMGMRQRKLQRLSEQERHAMLQQGSEDIAQVLQLMQTQQDDAEVLRMLNDGEANLKLLDFKTGTDQSPTLQLFRAIQQTRADGDAHAAALQQQITQLEQALQANNPAAIRQELQPYFESALQGKLTAFALEINGSLKQLEIMIEDRFDGVDDRLGRIEKHVTPPETPPLDLSAYVSYIRKRYEHVEILEIKRGKDERIRLQDVYLDPDCKRCYGFTPVDTEQPAAIKKRIREANQTEELDIDDEEKARRLEAYRNAPPEPALQVVQDVKLPHALITGGPGCGKSTLLRWLLLDWVEKNPLGKLGPGHPPPVLAIELRQLARYWRDRGHCTIPQFFANVPNASYELNQAALEAYLAQHETVFLFDGLDEIFDVQHREEISCLIVKFAAKYPHCRVRITSRIVGFDHRFWEQESFPHYLLEDYTPEQIDQFLQNWFQHAEEDDERRETAYASINRAMEESADTQDLAGNPLMLTLLALLSRGGDLPQTKSDLYREFTELQLNRWKTNVDEQDHEKQDRPKLRPEEKLTVVKQIAHVMQTGQDMLAANSIASKDLHQAIMDAVADNFPASKSIVASHVMETLHARNHIICDLGGQEYAFVHRSFLEYFCALDLIDQRDELAKKERKQWVVDLYLEKWSQDKWPEILLLLVDLLEPSELIAAVEALRDLGLEKDKVEEQWQILMVAMEYLTASLRHEPLRELRQNMRKLLMQYWSSSDTKFQLWHNPINHTFELFEDIKPFQIPIYNLAENKSYNEFARFFAIDLLVQHFHDSVDTLLLLQRITQDKQEAEQPRVAAIHSLAEHFRQNDDTLPMLQHISQDKQEAEQPRQAAIRSLAEYFRQDADTLPMLQRIAQDKQEAEGPRQAAIHSLAEHFRQDADTLPMLQRIAQNKQEAKGLRKAAIRSLAECFRQDADTLSMLQGIAQDKQETKGLRKEAKFWINHLGS